MSNEHSLPDDLNQWPTDPFALLGISHRADQREARRSYVRLIRKFKPEHAPEHFQRIRSAFDYVQRQIEVREKYGWYDDEDDDPAKSPSMTHSETEFQSDEDAASGSRQPESRSASVAALLVDPCDEAWDLAIDGRERDAYDKLLGIVRRGEQTEQAAIELYWLLAAFPNLDAERLPCDWLVEALKASRLTGPASELYQREIRANREEALSDRCRQLLDVHAEPGALADLLTYRWRAMSFLQRGDLIAADLAPARRRLEAADDNLWGRMLLTAIDHMAWFAGTPAVRTAFEQSIEELDRLAHLHVRLGDELDRMDLLIELSEGWQRIQFLQEVPNAWPSVVPLFWTQPFTDVRPHLLPVLKAISDRPFESLGKLDQLRNCCNVMAAQLAEAARQARHDFESSIYRRREWTSIRNRVEQFLRSDGGAYPQLRPRLLQFCLCEAIDPTWVGEAADELSHAEYQESSNLSDLLRGDAPLQTVYSAYRAMHG